MIGRRTVLSFGVLFLAACEGDFLSYEAETPAERELRESREALQSTVGQGSLVGAAGGAAIGVLLGGGLGGARGAQIGQLVGAGAGNYVRQLQEEFATEEEVLGQVISDIQATNARLERTIAAMQAVLAEQRAQVVADSTRVERNASEAVAAVEAAEVQERFFGQTRSLLIETGAPVTSSAYDGELGRLQSRIAAMRDIASNLADL